MVAQQTWSTSLLRREGASKRNLAPKLLSERFRVIVVARYRTRQPSYVRFDAFGLHEQLSSGCPGLGVSIADKEVTENNSKEATQANGVTHSRQNVSTGN